MGRLYQSNLSSNLKSWLITMGFQKIYSDFMHRTVPLLFDGMALTQGPREGQETLETQ